MNYVISGIDGQDNLVLLLPDGRHLPVRPLDPDDPTDYRILKKWPREEWKGMDPERDDR